MPDQDNSFASQAVPEVQNRSPKAPGILPKNAQTWVMVAIAFVMVLVIAFSNSGTPKPKAGGSAPSQTGNPPNQRRIDEYRAMVDEEARKLALERQRLEQAKLQAQAAAQGGVPVPGTAPYGTNPYGTQSQNYQPAPVAQPSPEELQRIALEAERKKREYASLFSSNVALSYRKDASASRVTTEAAAGLPPLQSLADQLNAYRQALQMPPLASPATVASVAPDLNLGVASAGPQASQTPNAGNPSEVKRKQQADDPALQQSEGKKFRLFEGTVLETVLTNRLNGSFSGPVNAMVTTNVYSHDHQELLIPQGTRVLGEVQRVSSLGQQRLAVFFHRLIMPDGYSLSLDQFHGLNQIGETGLRDKVNHHYAQIFGVSLAIGAIAGIEQAGARYGANYGGVDAYRQGVATSLSQSGLQILEKYLNILPTFEIREGHRIKVYLTDDLFAPGYSQHRLPGNL